MSTRFADFLLHNTLAMMRYLPLWPQRDSELEERDNLGSARTRLCLLRGQRDLRSGTPDRCNTWPMTPRPCPVHGRQEGTAISVTQRGYSEFIIGMKIHSTCKNESRGRISELFSITHDHAASLQLFLPELSRNGTGSTPPSRGSLGQYA